MGGYKIERTDAEALRGVQGVIGGEPDRFPLVSFLEVEEEMGYED